MKRAVRVALISGIAGAAVATAIGYGSFSPSATPASAVDASVVLAGDVGWNGVTLSAI
ncbi:hypothetical protein ACFXN2_01460 [Streptomyces kronopolitis]|uniref:hypothetical protein n=1 Tax=Streptomyces kronopolitis TaxID=1612435 RepID=UPI0036D0AD59